MKRPLVFVAVLLAIAVFSAAAAQTITYWHTYSTGSGEEQTMLKQVIPRFEAENPGIKVEAVGFPYDEFRQKLLTAFAGGVVPDLVRMDIIWVPEFAEMGALEPLDGYAGFAELRDGVFPGPLATNFWDGAYYGLPLGTNTQVMLYNSDVIGTPPTTFDELEALAVELSNPGENQWAFAVPGPWAWYFLPWIWSNGGALTDDDITVASGYLNGPATVAAVEMLVDWYERGLIAPTINNSGLGSWEGLGAGAYLATQDGPWAHPSITGQYPYLSLEHAFFPAGPAGSISIVGGEDVVMFNDSRNKEAAWKFLQFLLSPWTQGTMATTGQIPVINAALEDPYIVEHPYYAVYLEQLQTAKPRTPHPAYTRIETAVQNAVQRVLLGELSAQEALDRASAEVDALLK